MRKAEPTMQAPGINTAQVAFRDDLEKSGCLRAAWLGGAILAVPRHLFIEQYYAMDGMDEPVLVDREAPSAEALRAIYSDQGLMLRKPPNHSAASQPALVMQMLAFLEVEPGLRVLEIGTGSGWNAALMAHRVGGDELVHSVDIQPDLVESARRHLQDVALPKVSLTSGDGGFGWEERAPFDRITVTVGTPDIPPAWHEQLAEGGLLLLPFKLGAVGDPLLRLRKSRSGLRGSFVGWSGFATLQGKYWTGCADPLYPPPGSDLADLLASPATEVELAARANISFLLYAQLEGMDLRIIIDPSGSFNTTPTVYHKESHSLASLDPERPAVHVRGSSAFAADIAAMVDRWAKLRRPRLTDYQIDVVPSPADGQDPSPRWLVRTANATLGFTLPNGDKRL